jgi:hypothetical protein
MTGCASGAGVAVGGAGAAGAGTAGAGDAGAGAGGRRGRAGLEAAGFSSAAVGTAIGVAVTLGSCGSPAPVALSAGGIASSAGRCVELSAETRADVAGAVPAAWTGPVPGSACVGKAALTSFGDGAAVASPGAAEAVASGSVGRRGGRRRRGGGGLCALGGSAILGSTPLFRHIKGIPDLGAILPSA